MSSVVEAGVVTSVDVKPIGSPVVGAAVTGDTSVFVNDNIDFTPGDQVLITTEDDAEGQLYYVDSVDDEEGVTFTSPLMDDVPEGSWVSPYPLQQETRATVRLAESGEVRECVVLHTLADALRPGIRDETTSETVLTVLVSDVRYVFDVVARQTIRDVSEALPGVPPAKPDAPTLSTLAYLDSMHQLRAQITATWNPVTTNTDGTDITDLDHYEVQTKGATGDWQTYTSTPGDIVQAFIRNLEPGSAWSVRVRAVDTSKNPSEWSDPTSTTAATDNVAPSTPSRPTLTSRLGVITIIWDGKNSSGGAMEDDLAYVEVHLSTSSGFTPSSSTKIDQFPKAMSGVWGPATFGTTYYVKFVAVDTSGNASSASLQQSTAVAALVDVSNFPDSAMEVLYARTGHFIQLDSDQINANSIASDFLETGVIVGGIFQTTSGGEFRTSATPSSTGGIRIRGTDGMKAWNSSGVQKFSIDPSTGLMTAVDGTFSGTITSSTFTGGTFQTSTSGQRVVIDTSNRVTFYDSSGFVGYIYGGSGTLRLDASTVAATGDMNVAGVFQASRIIMTGSGTMNVTGKIAATSDISGGGDLDIAGDVTANSYYMSTSVASSGGNALFEGAVGLIRPQVAPSLSKWKRDVTPLPVDLDSLAELGRGAISFRYRDDVDLPFGVDDFDEVFHGVNLDLALQAGGLDLLIGNDDNDEPFQFLSKNLPIALLAGYGHDHERIDALERRLQAAGI